MMLFMGPVPLSALPQGAQVTHGQASIQQSLNQLVIQNSDRAIIQWDSFSIAQGQLTEFMQSGANSTVLNRVVGGNLSEIYGTLRSNGQVVLINPSGVLIGPGGMIDTQGFIASTLELPDTEFLQGGVMNFSGDSTAAVINLGQIDVGNGDVFLIASQVRNEGTILSDGGHVGLAAGQQVRLAAEGEQRLSVRMPVDEALSGEGVVNSGAIEAAQAEIAAAQGNVYALAIRNEGRVHATGVENRGGRIWLTASSGGIENSGELLAEGGEDTVVHLQAETGTLTHHGIIEAAGGRARLLGHTVRVAGSVDVSSDRAGGGEIYLGGDFQGSGVLQRAKQTRLDEGARLLADSSISNGGKVIVWADGETVFRGSISAQAFGETGDGGFVEVSGKQHVVFAGVANMLAANGQAGTLLLDPENIEITDAAPAPTYTQLTTAAINTQLGLGDFVIETSGAGGDAGIIRVSSAVSNASGNNLSLLAMSDIELNANIELTAGGTLTLVAGWDGNLGSPASVDGNGSLALSGNRTLQANTINVYGDFNMGANDLNINATDVTLLADNPDFSRMNFSGGRSTLHLGPTSASKAIELGGSSANYDVPENVGDSFTNLIVGHIGGTHAMVTANGDWDAQTNVTLNSGTLQITDDLDVGNTRNLTINNAGAFTTDNANNFLQAETLTFGGAGTVGSGTRIRTRVDTVVFNASSGNIFLNEDGDIALQGTHNANLDLLTGNLGNGVITQGGGQLDISGGVTLANSGPARDITLTHANNSFGALNISGNNVSLASDADLIDGTGGITAATLTINTPGRTVTFDNVANDVDTLVVTNALTVNITDADDIDLGALTVTDDLSVIAGGVITDSGVINVADQMTLNTSGFAGAGNVELSESGAFTFGDTLIGGNLILNAGAVSDAGAVQVGGTVTTNGGTTVTFNNLGGQITEFTDAGGNINVASTGTIDLGARTTAGGINVTSSSDGRSFNSALTGGDAVVLDEGGHNFGGQVLITTAHDSVVVNGAPTGITQSGDWSIGGTSRLRTENNGAITANRAGNNFNRVDIIGGTTQLTDTNAITIGASDINGDFTLVAGGDITDTAGVIDISGLTSVNAGGGDFLWDTAHLLNEVTVSNAVNVEIRDQNALTIAAGGITATTSVALTTDGLLQDSGSIVTGTLTLATGTNGGDDVNLDDANTDVDTLNITSADEVRSFVDKDDLVLGVINVDTAFNLTVNGALSDSGEVFSGGNTTLTVGAGNDITLDTATNDLASNASSSLRIISANNVILVDEDDLDMGASTISGTLSVTTSGALTDSGNITVAGASATFAVGVGNDLTLNSAGNDFNSVLINSARDVAIVDTDAIDFGASTMAGNLSVTAGGVITDSGALSIGGDLLLNTTNDPANNAGNVTIVSTSGFNFTTATVGGDLTLDAAGNEVTDSGALLVAGQVTTPNATTVDFDEFGSNINDFRDGGGKRTIAKVGIITLGASTEAGGIALISSENGVAFNSVLNANDAIILDHAGNNISGNVSVTTDTDSVVAAAPSGIQQTGAWDIDTGTLLKAEGAGDVALTQVGNDFTGSVELIANDVAINDVNAIDFAVSTISGAFTPTAGGDITDSGDLTVGGVMTLSADDGTVIFDRAANDFQGAVLITGDNAVSLVDANSLELGAGNLDADLTLATGGAVTQSAALTVTGTLDVTATAGGIVLEQNNDFNIIDLTASTDDDDIRIKDVTGNMVIAGISNSVGGGANNEVRLNASGTVTQTGAIAGELLLLSGAGSFTLTNNANNVTDFAADAFSVSYTDADSFNLDTVGGVSGLRITGGAVTLDTVGAAEIYMKQDLDTNGGELVVNSPLHTAGGDRQIDTDGGDFTVHSIVGDGTTSRKMVTILSNNGDVLVQNNLGTDNNEHRGVRIEAGTGDVQINGLIEVLDDTGTGGSKGLELNANNITLGGQVNTRFGGGIDITNAGTLIINADWNTQQQGDGNVLINGTGVIQLAADITGDRIQIDGDLTLIDNSTIVATGDAEAVIFNGKVDGSKSLTINAGNGDVTFAAAVGSGATLAGLAVNNADDLDFQGTLITDSGGIDLNAATVDFLNTVSTTNGGSLTMSNSGLATVQGAMNLDGAFLQDGAGETELSAGITTTGDAITFDGGTVELKANVALNTGSGAGSIRFDENVYGAYAMTLTAGNGDIDFESTLGNGTALTGLLVNSAANLDFENTLTLASGGLDITAGTVDFRNTVTTTAGGGVEISNSALMTTAAAADMNLDGGFIQNGAGQVRAAGDITTTGDAIQIAGALELDGDVAFDTTNTAAAGATIELEAVSASAAGVHDLTLNAGTGGDLTVSGAVGSTRLGVLQVVDADDVNFQSSLAVSGLNITESTSFSSAGQINTSGADIVINADGAISPIRILGGADLNGQDMLLTAGGNVEIGNTVLSSGGGAGERVLIRGFNAADTYGLGDDASGDIQITEASLANVAGSIDRIEIGRSGTQSGAIIINDVSDDDVLTLATGLTLHADGGTAVVSVLSDIVTAGGDLTVKGSAQSVRLDAGGDGTLTLNTGGGDLVIDDHLTFLSEGDDLNIQSAGGTVSLNGTINTNTTAAGGENISITSGGGSVTFGRLPAGTDTLGSAGNARLGALQVNAGNGDVTINAALTALRIAVTGGSGTLLFRRALDLDNGSAATVLQVDSMRNVTFADAASVNTANGGAVSIDGDGAGTLNIGTGGMTLDGAFTETDFNAVVLNSDVSTTGDAISFASSLTLAAPRSFSSGGGSGNITFAGAVNATGQALVLNAGTGDITMTHAANSAGTLTLTGGAVQVTENEAMEFGDVNANSLVATASGIMAQTVGSEINVNGSTTLDTTGFANAGKVTMANDGGDMDFGASTIGGDFDLTTSGRVTDSGVVIIAGELDVIGGGVAIFDESSNAASVVIDSDGNVTVTKTGIVDLTALGIGVVNGDLTVVSKEDGLTFNSVLAPDAVVLNNAANTFGGQVVIKTDDDSAITNNAVTGIVQTAPITVEGAFSATAEDSNSFVNAAAITLTQANDFKGTVSTSGGETRINDTTAVSLLNNSASGARMELTAGGTITQSGVLQADELVVTASADTTLNQSNKVNKLAINAGANAVNFRNASGFEVQSIAGVNGIIGGSVVLTADSGDVLVPDLGVAHEVDASGTLTITLAGANGLFTSDAGADIEAGGAITLLADRMQIGATIDGGVQPVTLAPSQTGRTIDLGSATDSAGGTLELSDAELDRVTTSHLKLGNTTSGNIQTSASLSLGTRDLTLTSNADVLVSELVTLTGTLTVAGTAQANTVTLVRTFAGAPVVVNTGGGNDTLKVGSGTLDNISSTVTFNAGSGVDTLLLDDSLETDGSVFTVTSNSVVRTEGSVTVNYADVSTLRIDTGVANDVLNGNGSLPRLDFRMGAGNDSVMLAGASYNTANRFTGGSGADTVNLSAIAGDLTVDASLLSGISQVTGGQGINTLAGGNTSQTWQVAGTARAMLADMAIENFDVLQGGMMNDLFTFGSGVSFAGSILGGAGTDTLDFSAVGEAVTINLFSGTGSHIGAFQSIENLLGVTQTTDSGSITTDSGQSATDLLIYDSTGTATHREAFRAGSVNTSDNEVSFDVADSTKSRQVGAAGLSSVGKNPFSYRTDGANRFGDTSFGYSSSFDLFQQF